MARCDAGTRTTTGAGRSLPGRGSTRCAGPSSIRGSGLGYHHGIDISVRDDRPVAGAPPGRTHRVYALEGGPVRQALSGLGPWEEGIVRIGHFGYGHIEPIVQEGQVVAPGEMIGWTTRREWHLHLSEWHFPGGRWERRVPVNPLSRNGKLAPYADTKPPVIHDIRFMTPSDPGWRVGNGRAIYRLGGSPLDPERSPASSTSGPGSTIRSRSAAGFERCPSSRPRITRAASR